MLALVLVLIVCYGQEWNGFFFLLELVICCWADLPIHSGIFHRQAVIYIDNVDADPRCYITINAQWRIPTSSHIHGITTNERIMNRNCSTWLKLVSHIKSSLNQVVNVSSVYLNAVDFITSLARRHKPIMKIAGKSKCTH